MKTTVNKMLRIVRGDTGGSLIYAEMLLSLLNRGHKVNIARWSNKADRDDFEAIIQFMINFNNYKTFEEYEKLVFPHLKELEKYVATGGER